MFSLLKKTVQPMKILFNKNKHNVIKPSTIKVSSIPNRQHFLIPNKLNINYLRTFHSGLAVQDIQRAGASKSFSPFKIPVPSSKVRETVVKQYVYPLTKPEMSLVKNRGKTEIPPEEFLACDLMSIIAAGAVVLWILSWSIPSDPMSRKLDQLNETIDKKVKRVKIELEYWTALDETIKNSVAITKITEISQTDKLSQKVTEELNGRPKEELSPKLAHIQEKIEEMQQQDTTLITEAVEVLTEYGSIWSYTEEQKITTTQKLHLAIPGIKKQRKMLEDIYALIQNLNMEDFCKNDDTETKNDCNCS